MDFGLERTKGTFNPDVLPRRRTVGSPVIRHCFVLVPPFVFVSLLNVQLARALRSLFHCIVMITRSTRESQVEECVSLRRFLNEDRSKFNIYENSRAESLVSGGSLKNISIGAFPFFFLHSSLTCFVLCPRLGKYRGGRFARWQGEGKESGGGENLMDFPPRVRTGVPFLRPRALLVSPQWKEHSGTNCYPLP